MSRSNTYDAFMRLAAGLEPRTLSDKINDPNRPTWEKYKKDNEDKLSNTTGDLKKMAEYRAELDREREKRLYGKKNADNSSSDSSDTNEKKKKRKHKHGSDNSVDSSDDSSDSEKDKKHKKKHKKKHSKHKHKKDRKSKDNSKDCREPMKLSDFMNQNDSD